MTDAAGTVLGSRDYNGFGGITASSGTGLDRYAYTGREWDGTLGLEYARARMYDPGTGRFNTEDPLGLGAGDANVYRYVGNDPADATDPSGMAPPPSGTPLLGRLLNAAVNSNPFDPLGNFNRWVEAFSPEIEALGNWLRDHLAGDGSGLDLSELLDSAGAWVDHAERVRECLKKGDVREAAERAVAFQVGVWTASDNSPARLVENPDDLAVPRWAADRYPDEYAGGKTGAKAADTAVIAGTLVTPMPPLPWPELFLPRLGRAGGSAAARAQAVAAREARLVPPAFTQDAPTLRTANPANPTVTGIPLGSAPPHLNPGPPALPASPQTLGYYIWPQNGQWYYVPLASPTAGRAAGIPLVTTNPGQTVGGLNQVNWGHVEVQGATLSNLNNVPNAYVIVNNTSVPGMCNMCKGTTPLILGPNQTIVVITEGAAVPPAIIPPYRVGPASGWK